MLSKMEKKVLEIISQSDGKLSWYQVERSMSNYYASGEVENVYEIIKLLCKNGYISESEGYNKSQPLYSLTEKAKS